MYLNLQTICTCLIVITGVTVAIPVLIRGFKRRGTGVKYERNFLIQRAPQFLALVNVALIVFSFFLYIQLIPGLPYDSTPTWIFAFNHGQPTGIAAYISWLGVLILLSGMIFMVGGWYCLGDYFSTDAELLDGQGIRNTGFFKYVMHPIYSGIIQCLFGASLACTSIFCALFLLFVVAPLWLKRAQYEEKLLLENLGPSYKQYAEQTKWRRIVPTIFPIGV